MVTHSSILAWRIPWMEKPGGLQSTGSQRVRHDWATSLSLSFFFKFFSHLEYYRILCRIPCALQCPCWFSILHTVVYACQSQTPNLSLSSTYPYPR